MFFKHINRYRKDPYKKYYFTSYFENSRFLSNLCEWEGENRIHTDVLKT